MPRSDREGATAEPTHKNRNAVIAEIAPIRRFRWITIQRQLGAELGTGDILVLAEWDRCTRSMTDGISIIERVHKRGAFVKMLDRDYLDLTKPINRGTSRSCQPWPKTNGIASSIAPTKAGQPPARKAPASAAT